MLAITHAQPFGAACVASDPNALFKKLTGIKVLNAQIISDDDARGVNDALVEAVRCNARDAAVKVITPAVAIAGLAAIGAGVAAMFALRARRRR
jgi:hypothetical protein